MMEEIEIFELSDTSEEDENEKMKCLICRSTEKTQYERCNSCYRYICSDCNKFGSDKFKIKLWNKNLCLLCNLVICQMKLK